MRKSHSFARWAPTVLLPIALAFATPALAQPAIDWEAVNTALGREAAEQPGGVHRAGFPRSDLEVTLDGVTIKPGLALGGWVAFVPAGDGAMVMGDLVLLESEIQPVMQSLRESGIEITALHNHLLRAEPATMYMHIEGHGDAVELAGAIRTAVELTGAPPPSPPPAEPPALDFDVAAINAALGAEGRNNNGVLGFNIPRAETITHMGVEIPPAMGTGIVINFQPTGEGRAAIAGDFVLTPDEVNPVLTTLIQNGIEVVALHSHMLAEEPRLFFMHFWANDDAVRLAGVLGQALALTNRAAP